MAGEGGFEPAPEAVPVQSVIDVAVDGKGASPPSGPTLQSLQPSDFKVVSVIVTFDESVDPTVLESATGGQLIHRYEKIFNGASLVVPTDSVDLLAGIKGVNKVYLDTVLQVDTDSSPEFIGAPAVWEALGGQGSAGEGVVVGIIDTGIWPEHPSFADDGTFPPAPELGPSDRSACDFGNTAWNPDDAPFTCNNKLIGAYEFMDTYKVARDLSPNEFDSARDSDGHGSHTGSTAAGNADIPASIMGAEYGTVSGIAPRAHVIAYRVCGGPTGSCFASDSAAAVEQAILDGVDVLNFSIGGGGSPYTDAVSLAFLSAYENGIFVAASAGNSGPGADTTGHREPWTTTAGASTQSRTFKGLLDLSEPGGDSLHLEGVSVTGDYIGHQVVLAADYGDALCLTPFPAGTFNGEIVVCERGDIPRVGKSYNVLAGGAGGLVLYNPAVQSLNSDNHFLPTVHIDNVAGDALLDFMDAYSTTVVTGAIDGGVVDYGQGDVMAAFSSRGGPGQTLGISKPDITAPGVQILAANSPMPAWIGHPDSGAGPAGEYFQAIAGTSMSSPHIAGSGALLKALHPNWTPGQIKSALMTTATVEDVVKEDGVTPADAFDYGSGRVDLNYAGNPGLTISATGAEYWAHEHDLWNANYPSLYVPTMPGVISVQRTVHSELDKNSVWKTSVDSPADVEVSVPTAINVKAGADRTFDITVDARLVPEGEVRFATLYLTHKDKVLRFPITIVRDQPAVTLDKSCDPAEVVQGELTDCTITIQNTSFDEAAVSLYDRTPPGLPLVVRSVVGADQKGAASLSWDGSLYGAAAPEVTVADGTGTTPAGYLPLSLFGIAPIGGVTDETIVNFATDPFVFAGETWDRIGMVSNGYAVVGGGDGADIDYINQVLPDPARPNNVLAPFWTDLNPATGGALRAGYLTDGVNDWLILDWEAVPTWSGDEVDSFQIWIGVNGVEDISFTYGPVEDGDGGLLTVGAENAYGNSGQNWYANGTGTLVTAGDEVRVVSVPGAPGETHIITYSARGEDLGVWTNCAEMTGDLFEGVNVDCFTGETILP
jgi:subtilisin family serine protease